MAVSNSVGLFDELVNYLVAIDPETILAFKPSSTLEDRLAYLIEQNRDGVLTPDEQTELDEFLRLNHLVNMLKIRARKELAHRV
ncbi:MAG: hypothetical protein SF123_24820 [Chloroflexota bacterium]|nr:hypothetical protein [Chloroflexota bacterium]